MIPRSCSSSYIYGYLNRVQSSRRLEREAGRNVEMMWLTGRLVPDHKTIAEFRKDNGRAIRKVCTRFVGLCREMGLSAAASVAIDGSKFKAVNNRDRNFTHAKMARRRAQIEASVAPTCSSSTPPTGRSPQMRHRDQDHRAEAEDREARGRDAPPGRPSRRACSGAPISRSR